MHKKLISYYYILLLLMTSCIVEYKPTLETNDTKQYIIDGKITNQEGYQIVKISYSSEIKTDVSIPEYNPLSGCQVYICDDKGNEFLLTEDAQNKGEYKAWIGKEYLNEGTAYKIDIITPEENEISSDYDIMPSSADIDSLYFIKEDILTTNPDEPIQGIQYYTDLTGMENQSSYYKFTVEETWEYHARYKNQGIMRDTLTIFKPPDGSKQICWRTQLVPEIFILSTEDLSENKYVKFPLHYVSSTTERLAYGYSVLLRLYSISENAFLYWSKIKKNLIENVGMYGKQPEQCIGNLYNMTNPNVEVLGYFYATSIDTKRIFTDPIKDLDLYYSDHCGEHLLLSSVGVRGIHPSDRPAYILFDGPYPIAWLGDDCVDCTLRGGITTKPDFWQY